VHADGIWQYAQYQADLLTAVDGKPGLLDKVRTLAESPGKACELGSRSR